MLEVVMRKVCSTVVKVVVGSIALIATTFVLGMRSKSPVVQDRVRSFNKRVGNPQQMKTAGQPGAWTSVVRHVGRVSGAAYETPVEAHPTDDGFVISLPYGPTTDWVKNVLAAGGATLVRNGITLAVDQPEVVSTSSMAQHLPKREQRMLRIFDVRDCLHVRSRAVSAEPPE
jgi:deazaflavin-dependent oxidoreductase (nitroreductase family)